YCFRIYHDENYPEFVFGQIYGGNKSNNEGSFYVKICPFQPKVWLDDPININRKPNVKIAINSLCVSFSTVARAKYDEAIIRVYGAGLAIVVDSLVGDTGSNSCWGDCSSEIYYDTKIDNF